jgi:hypothetical protein
MATLSGYAYSGLDNRTALGNSQAVHLISDSITAGIIDTAGPALQLWIGSHNFQSGDVVSMHSTTIVDVHDIHGLNTSTASIGHNFIAWVDNGLDSAVDLSPGYVSKENDFADGTSQMPMDFPPGHHTLHVRAFDTYDNASSASVDFIAKADAPYDLYNVLAVPDPVTDHTTISFTQPGQNGDEINVTLSIYTTSGQLVRTIEASSNQSVIEVPWDARDNRNVSVANGAYVFIIDANDQTAGTSSTATGKCIVTR